ncbi:MAG: M28 family peptidase [Acidobacteria bacterium]|nr:MAG: M28 family peptidase [Acidobacteriota bacterium]GIK77692.1 MAG: hypothetical protein BroJett022_13820 [Actinomycetes bacterium]
MRKTTYGTVVVTALLAAIALSPVAKSKAAVSPVDALDMGYVERVTADLTEIGSTPAGFRVFGTPQDRQTARYLSARMEALGLDDVGVERMRGDGWLFKGASVDIHGGGGNAEFDAASLGGVPGTPKHGVSGKVVDVGYGTAPEYRGLNVRGKVVYARWDFDNRGIWPNLIAEEAKLHGAKAAIIASGPDQAWYSAGGGRALGSNDGECSLKACAPMVTISKRDAGKLEAAIDRDAVQAKVRLDAENRLGATGYQAIGSIRGSGDPDRVIVFTAHHDAWFESAGDDSVGVAMMLAMAKAVKDSGYSPYYTWVFAPVTGEEYGLANAYADWLQGAYHRVTDSHREWRRKAVAAVNWEVHSPPYWLGAGVSYEIRDTVTGALDDAQASGQIPAYGADDVYSWNDGFVYQAAGIPSVTFAATGDDYWTRYHTDHDSLDSLDFPSLEPVLAAEAGAALALDRPQIPYGFDGRLASLAASLDPATIERFGGDADAAEAAYGRLAAAWEEARSAPYSTCSMRTIRSAVGTGENRLTALYLGEGTSYPHQQAEVDITGLSDAIDALGRGRWRDALAALSGVSLNSQAFDSSRPAYRRQLRVRSPGYPKLSWAVEGQYPLLLDLYDVTHQIRDRGRAGAPGFKPQIADLRKQLRAQTRVYRNRIDELAAAMDAIADELEAASAC